MNLLGLSEGKKSIAVVGMAKNTGKTTTVNFLISSAKQLGLTLGITSTGRDGETEDIITAQQKPSIFLDENSFLATARTSLSKGSARLEVLDTTGMYNALGEIVIAKVREAGTVEVSGPERTENLKVVAEKLQYFADLVILDGALDRIAASAPSVADACILATGAVIGRDVDGVVRSTLHCVRVLQTPVCTALSKKAKDIIEAGKIGVQGRDGDVVILPLSTAVDAPLEILDYLSKQNNRLLLGGAFSDELADLLISAARKIPELEAIVRDGTRIFAGESRWQRLLKTGTKIRVLEPVKLVAITVNPVDPRGRRLAGEPIIRALQEFLPEIYVFDPMAEGGF